MMQQLEKEWGDVYKRQFLNVTDKEYTVGIHADVGENTDIKVFVYDGKDTESYTR